MMSSQEESIVTTIASVSLVDLPGAPVWQEKVYRALLSTGETVDLFPQHLDVPLPPGHLLGLTIPQARKLRNERMLAIAAA
jgi:hypothetical protein